MITAHTHNPYAPDKPRQSTRIVVAMSGGVDSSTVAAMMHEQGYEVIGITLQLYDFGAALAKKGACCAGQDIADAREVCQRLGIPHYVLDYENNFKQAVMEEFADSYMRGETPIPCVRCNQTVKFRDLLKVARDMDADALVTGHYVQRLEGESGAEMHQAHDKHKDQSYFLFTTTQEQLNFLHFPLGGMTKEQTRAEALRLNIPVADKPDSQDICFVPNGDYAKVVERLRPGALDAGEIVHVDGRVIGRHDGIINFTRGQRRGIGIASPEPLYVVRIEADSKRVIVGSEADLMEQSVKLKDVNWLAGEIPEEGLSVMVKLRSAQKAVQGRVFKVSSSSGTRSVSAGSSGVGQDPALLLRKPQDDEYRILLENPERAITPGQAAVMYDGTRMLGGGWIVRN